MSGLISVIIPTRNRAAVLARCLDAFIGQASVRDRCEIIVVDDSSADHTPQVVQEFGRTSGVPVHCVRQQQPMGANAARNRGLEVARGEIIIFIDDDVIVPAGWLEKLLDGLCKVGCPVVSGGVRLTMEGPIIGKHRGEIQAHLGEMLTPPRGLYGQIVPVTCNMAAFRWVFDRAIFEETLRPPVEEGDWLLRAGVLAAFVPDAWVWHNKSADELRLKCVLKSAWQRGSEGGRWMRERLKMPANERLPVAVLSMKTCARALGHATAYRCWGGVVIGLGELAKALALVGLINWGKRLPKSWR